MNCVLLILCFLTAACGVKKGPVISSLSVPGAVSVSDFDDKVEFSADIPQGLAALLKRELNSIGLCTSFLISESLVLTNSHCVTNILPEDCGSKLRFHVQTKAGREIRSCGKILKASELVKGSMFKPDYAVIELSAPVATAAIYPISREGFQDKEQFLVRSIDFSRKDDGTLRAAYKEGHCQAVAFSVIGFFSEHKSSIVPIFPTDATNNNCQVIRGNSGSPVQNASGKVVGVLFGVGDDPEKHLPKEALPAKVLPVAYTTNLSCVKLADPAFDKDIDPRCQALAQEQENYNTLLQKRFATQEKADKEVQRAGDSLTKVFKYRVQNIPGSQTKLTFTPYCMRSPTDWPQEEQDRIERVSGKRTFKTAIPDFNMDITVVYDSYLRPSVKARALEIGSREYTIPDVDRVKHGRPGNVLMSVYASDAARTESLQLGLCAQD